MAALYADFGDVRGDDFRAWWNSNDRGAFLFAEQPLSASFKELASPQEWGTEWNPQTVMVLAVPLEMSKRYLKGAFGRLLEKRHPGHTRGRPSLGKLKEVSSARYRLERNYTIASLQTTLAVYDAWLENQKQANDMRKPLWEIGAELKINRNAIRDATSPHHADRLVGRNILAATTSRYVKQAKAIITNTGRGRFPDQRFPDDSSAFNPETATL